MRVVPHGAPARLTARAAAAGRGPERARRADAFRLSTFGLISPGKGLETVIEAMPAMLERHPEVVYTVAGRTHPDIAHREGERYRLMLERRVHELGLDASVEFDDRFLSLDQLSDLLAATDVFVTPYRSREQISSGALTFAIAAGCGVVSTPYWYAQDMLASGAGRLVPFEDPAALADAVCDYVEQPELLAAARAEARRIGSSLAWPAVAEATASVLARGARSGAAPPAEGGRRPPSAPPCATTTCSRSSTTSGSCSTRTGSSPTATAATASTTSPAWRSSRSRSPAAATSRSGRRSSTARSPSSTRPPTTRGCATS